ncbi:hypothetical protein QJQ45_029772 [Haematococcus lacustris]|nr:hypothetical protein QJQ45_029772 [Haematococcus lacustris]
MEAKMAFETLSDNRKRAEYDRRLRMVGAAAWIPCQKGGDKLEGGLLMARAELQTGAQMAMVAAVAGPEEAGHRSPSHPTAFLVHSLMMGWCCGWSQEDLLRDLNNELSAWDKARRARKAARASSSSNSNKSQKGLLEELTEVGEKFVDFLEDAFGTLGAATQDTAGTGDNSKSSKPRSSVEEFDHLYASYGERLNQEAAASRQQQQQRPPPATSTAKSEEDIDAMLADLKRKVRR